jgi:hypothetical protein
VKLLLLSLGLAAAALLPATARSATTPASYAGQCGIPATQPVWADFGWPNDQFTPLFGKPGITLGVSSGVYPSQMRALGAATVYFDLNFNKRIGTTVNPADPSTVATRAQSLFTYAVAQTGCATPVIVLNELAGAGLVTPWSDGVAQYRQNALAFVQALAGLGAHPVLLIAAAPYTGGDAAAWWQQAAASAEIVREDYIPAPGTYKLGPLLGNRSLRIAYRNAISAFTAIGIPASRLGLMISFATSPGFGGRSGLQPASAWYQVAKWEALSARQVAVETGIASVWSWGWGEWNAAEQDPDKPYALCTWLWVRSPALCDAPKAIGAGFDASLTEGQLSLLPAGAECVFGAQTLTTAAIQQLEQLTDDPDTATSAEFEQLVENAVAPVPESAVLAAEKAVILQEFRGSRAIYLGALAKAHASVDVARAILAGELRQAAVEATLPAGTPSAADIQTFYSSYPTLPVRLVSSTPAASWLGGKPKGLALSQVAPNRLFSLATGASGTIRTTQGTFTVKALQDAVPLGAVPLGKATPAIRAALESFQRGQAFEQWTVAKQRAALNTAICAGDDLPQPAAIDLTSYLPFLRLG